MAAICISSWRGFKSLVERLAPETVFYLAEPHLLREPPLGLRLTFYHDRDIYVFVDCADSKTLYKTGIPIIRPNDRLKVEVRGKTSGVSS